MSKVCSHYNYISSLVSLLMPPLLSYIYNFIVYSIISEVHWNLRRDMLDYKFSCLLSVESFFLELLNNRKSNSWDLKQYPL